MKKRLDVLLVEQGFFETRAKAQAAIMERLVFADGKLSDKAGNQYNEEVRLEVKGDSCPFVGRGGLKLAKALETFDCKDLGGFICADIGASTGGFTDCMLQNGAAKVYAIDCGYGQLDYRLRCDERVINMERTNVRYLELEKVPEAIDFISIDVSFISLGLVLPIAKELFRGNEKGQLVCLIKPQFEAGREQVGKNGIVRDPAVHLEVIEKVARFGEANGLHASGLTFSPIKGAKGNIEYLMYMKNQPGAKPQEADLNMDVSEIMESLKAEEIVRFANEQAFEKQE